jgi:hypothetical protein
MGVDLILALDNDSADETTAVLKEFVGTGRLVYFFESSHDFIQDVWVTQLARIAFFDYKADWIINSDADEFFIPHSGTLKDALMRVPPAIQAISIKRNDMVPIERPETRSPPEEMIFRKRTSLEWVNGHPILDKVIHRAYPDIQVARGSHSVTSRFIKQQIPVSEIITFHYPIRSFEQFSKKVGNIGYGRKKANLKGSRYDYWYACLQEGKLEDVYRGYRLNQRQIREKVTAGELIEDHKLADILAQIAQRGIP